MVVGKKRPAQLFSREAASKRQVQSFTCIASCAVKTAMSSKSRSSDGLPTLSATAGFEALCRFGTGFAAAVRALFCEPCIDSLTVCITPRHHRCRREHSQSKSLASGPAQVHKLALDGTDQFRYIGTGCSACCIEPRNAALQDSDWSQHMTCTSFRTHRCAWICNIAFGFAKDALVTAD
jgi:hypothetical protein